MVGTVVALLTPAAPAQAHDVGGVGATNFRTTLSALTQVAGSRSWSSRWQSLELRNTTGTAW
jgi:hypothetical protein